MRKWLLILALCAIAFLLSIAIQQITTETALTATQVESRVTALYEGDIVHTVKRNNLYFVTFRKEDYVYEVAVHEINGGFSQLTLLTAPSTQTKPPIQTEAPAILLITEQQAVTIALSAFPGQLEDVDFKQAADGAYYLIEIETAHEDVTVQVHAVTGKILSFTFDD